jgi:hypothetical protein
LATDGSLGQPYPLLYDAHSCARRIGSHALAGGVPKGWAMRRVRASAALAGVALLLPWLTQSVAAKHADDKAPLVACTSAYWPLSSCSPEPDSEPSG